MSPRVFDGWTPTEVHEHQVVDPDTGETTTTGYTVVHRESEWDDDARARAEELEEWERGYCPCGCRQRAEHTMDPEQVWSVETFTCHATKARAKVSHQMAEERGKRDEHWSDGVTMYAVPVADERPAHQRSRTRRKEGTTDGD